ncbi:dihydrodipicolinate synthase family protein [Erwinia endophytica]|uniref:dihydrodipicolinate synthase family protein n=1 Tax=Erwinia endophytica TaxID=1563158 RepID=UPI001265F887|nr:dihydrodipicolinate synthase family protein [Erwinia endophytica]KAB8305231.1 dihydrodipicolinate synthase family protein [Erwinia endophytica]
MNSAYFSGVNAAVLTAFNRDLSVNYEKTVEHGHWLLNNGCNGLAVLGTTSETNSLSLNEREMLLEKMIDGNIPAEKMLPGTSTCDIPSTVKLTRHAERMGCRGVLLLPPFYYKSPSTQGLFDYYSEVIGRAGGDIKIYLYHFPQQSAIPVTLDLVKRLLDKYPDKIKGIKDSSGDFQNTKAYIDNFSQYGFEVYSGADASFQEVLKIGAAGCITATTNLVSSLAAKIYQHYNDKQGNHAQEKLTAMRKIVATGDTIPTVKTLLSAIMNDNTWETVRPPLCSLSPSLKTQLLSSYAEFISV